MGNEEVFEALKSVLIDRLKIEADEIKADARLFEDLGLDSIDLMTAVMAIEEKFGIEVPDTDLENVVTVENAVSVLSAKVKIGA